MTKMFNKLTKPIRRQLLKIDWVKHEVEAYQTEKKKQQLHEHWGRLMHSGCTVRELKPKKLDPLDTFGIVTDDGLLEEWQGGKVVAQGVAQGYIDSTNWGGKNIGS